MRNSFFFGCLFVLFSLVVMISMNIADLVHNALAGKRLQLGGSVAYASVTSMTPVERIKKGEINCRNCDLSGADLSRECVKHGDLTGAKFDNTKAQYMCMSFANFTGASFRNADLTGANLGHSNLKNANLKGAKLNITNIRGADLSTATGLTQAQIDLACGDAETKLPPGLKANSCS